MFTKSRILSSFILSIFIALLGFYTYRSTHNYKNATEWISHTQEVIGTANSLLSGIQDVESSQRGFVITGDHKFLDSYIPGIKKADSSFSRLKKLVSDNTNQEALIDSLAPLIKTKEEFAARVISTRDNNSDYKQSQELMTAGEGEDLMKQIKSLINRFTQHEKTLLSVRLEKADSDFHLAITYISAGICLAILIVLLAGYLLQVDTDRRKKTELHLKESENLLKKFLNSLPVGVFILSKTGEVYYANDKSAEILGKGILPTASADNLSEIYPTVKAGTDTTYPPDELPIVRALKGETNLLIEDLELIKNNKRVPLRVNATKITNEAGEVEYAIAVFEDVTVLKESEAKLKEATKLAQESVKLKESFLANMSHEIRTPMNAIVGFTELLLKQQLTDKQQDYVKTIKTSGDNLLRIINDILDVSKIESGIMTFEETQISIKELFASLKNMLQPKANDKKINLSFTYEQNLPDVVLGDSTRLTQIIVNLVGNAIKFTEKGGVSVYAKTVQQKNDDYTIEFSVKDTGIGIREDKLKTIFERFRQAENSTTRNYGGTGLGLSIAKELVEMQNGNINVTSTVGKGSGFTFTLTFKKADKPTKKEEKKQHVNMQEMAGFTTLMVEDNPINTKYIQILFDENNLKLDTAADGREALNMLSQKKYDVVLMDIEMPEMNGYETTQAIRNELKSNIPIIAMTANALAGERDKCMQAGMDDYLSKPIQSNVLFDKLYGIKLSVPIKQTKNESTDNVISLDFLLNSLDGNNSAIIQTLDIIISEIPNDLKRIQEAVDKSDYTAVKRSAHRMKSTVGIVSAERLLEILSEMEKLGTEMHDMDKIILLNDAIGLLCKQITIELKNQKKNTYEFSKTSLQI